MAAVVYNNMILALAVGCGGVVGTALAMADGRWDGFLFFFFFEAGDGVAAVIKTKRKDCQRRRRQPR